MRLMPPAHVKPYVKRQKNDTADAEAILRSGHEAKHAVRADQNGRATELTDASSCAPSLDSPTDCGHQLDPRVSCQVFGGVRKPCNRSA